MSKAFKPAAFFAVFMLVATLSACGGKTVPDQTLPDDTSAPEISTVPPTEPDTTEPLTDAGVEYTRQENEYVLTGDNGAELIRVYTARPVIEGFAGANDYYADWIADAEYTISLSLEDVQAQRNYQQSIGSHFYPYSYNADFEVTRNDGVLFSVLRTFSRETGGAHGGTDYMAENFVTETGALLTMDDLFAVPQNEYYPRIKDAVVEKIEQRYSSEGVLYGNYDQTMMDIYDPRHFCVTETGIIFFWQEYELGSFSAGAQVYEIPFGTLADILNPTWIK